MATWNDISPKSVNNKDEVSFWEGQSAINEDISVQASEPKRATVTSCNIIGESSEIKHALKCISIWGQFDAPVLVTGETGTGKELAARGLHYSGTRANKPFIAVNCATLTTDLFNSELFGHKKGAFTDARQDKKGLILAAEGGTLFLDEIDSLSMQSQAALLRFLQESEYRPVGSEKTIQSNVRIIASVNCNMEQLIEAGAFRKDLYYRLHILSVHMPSLTERRHDIPILVDHFLKRFSNQYGLGDKVASAELLRVFLTLPWRGNVRELENLIHRVYLTSNGSKVNTDVLRGCPEYTSYLDVGFTSTDSAPHSGPSNMVTLSDNSNISTEQNKGQYCFSEDKKIAIEAFEKQYVNKMLALSGGNVTRAAKMCGKERRAFGKMIKKYAI